MAQLLAGPVRLLARVDSGRCRRLIPVLVVACLTAACGSPRGAGVPLPPAPHPAVAGPAVASIKRTGILRVAADLSYRPFAFRDGGTPRGYEVDLASLLAGALGVRLEIVDAPRTAMRSGFGNADVMIAGWPAEGAPGLASTPYYRLTQGILWREGQTPRPDGSLRNLRVAVPARTPAGALAERLGAPAPLLTYAPDEALRSVSRGEVDAAVADFPLVAEWARVHPRTHSSRGGWSEVGLVVVVRPDAPDLLSFASAVIAELEQRNGLAQLRQRWGL